MARLSVIVIAYSNVLCGKPAHIPCTCWFSSVGNTQVNTGKSRKKKSNKGNSKANTATSYQESKHPVTASAQKKSSQSHQSETLPLNKQIERKGDQRKNDSESTKLTNDSSATTQRKWKRPKNISRTVLLVKFFTVMKKSKENNEINL